MGLLKDIKELVGINTGDEDDERDEELEEETTSKALSKRQKMEAEEVDEFRYEDYSTIFIDPKQFEDCKKIATYIEKEKNDYNQFRKYWTKCSSKNNGFLGRCYGN